MSDFKIVKLIDPPLTLTTNVKPSGVYNNSSTYGVGDSVSYGNNSYIAILATTGNIPTNTTYWQILASASANKLSTTGRNNTGLTILKGSVVYFSGASGNLPLLALAQANSEMSSTKTIGITVTDIPDNDTGEVVIIGLAENLNTSGFSDGASLYLSPSVPGGLTTTKPSAPDHMVFVGFVTRSHPSQGTIEVKIQNGFELQELHNVAISSLVDNQVLKYDAPNSLWKNRTLIKDDVGLSNVPNTDATNPANISQTSSYRFVTDAEKALWNYSASETFETVSKNLKSWSASFNYTSGALTSIVYTDGADTITKTFNYTLGVLTSIVLSGDTPSGVELTKTLNYTTGVLTSISYS
jgi:hypothetical protein